MKAIAEITMRTAQIPDDTKPGVVTTEHPASENGQPVVLIGGQVTDYSQIESLRLLDEGDDIVEWSIRYLEKPKGVSVETLQAAKALEAFGIRVTRVVPE